VTALLGALKAHGADAVSFQAVKAGTRWWHDAPPPEGTGAVVPYVASGGSWIAIGSPLTAPGAKADAVRRFASAARLQRRRAVFFGVEDLLPFAGCRRLMVGLQSVLEPSQWQATLRHRPRLREQLRRARAKGVTVRSVGAADLLHGTPLRAAVERLRREWLASRAMEPMGFLVAVEPFHAPAEHLYLVAERHGIPVQFLSAVPIYARNGWLMEDMLRGAAAPNGTTELVIDAAMRRLDGRSCWLTPGLTPLAGAIPWWLGVLRFVTIPLYDFSGLRHFRARLRPAGWRPIWIAWDRGSAIGVLIDVLRAFAGGRIVPFAWRTLVRHPNGPPWVVAMPLVPWTVLLAGVAVMGQSAMLGFSAAALGAWTVFDAILAWLLFRVARRPRRRGLAIMTAAAAFDAIVSVRHLWVAGFGPGLASAILRTLATAGPLLGTAGLAWAWWRAHRARRVHARTARTEPALTLH
jgi:phosphatidylglycerol lysyltransferase